MDELIAFLRARYDEIEDVTEEAAGDSGGIWLIRGNVSPRAASNVRTAHGQFDAPSPADALHAAVNDPAHVLAGIAGKRKIVDLAEQQAGYDLPAGVQEGRDDDERLRDEGMQDVMVEVLHHLAEEFADHPDYNRKDWGPLGSGNPVPE